MKHLRTADIVHGGAAGAILVIFAGAIGFMVAQAAGDLAAHLGELNRRSARIEALELRLKESQETTAAALDRIGATVRDLPLLEDPARLRAHLETICAVFDVDAGSAPCVIEERPLTEGLSEYVARRSGRGDLGAFAVGVVESLAPPTQARVLTLRGGVGSASQRLEIEARIIGAGSRALSENASTEADSES